MAALEHGDSVIHRFQLLSLPGEAPAFVPGTLGRITQALALAPDVGALDAGQISQGLALISARIEGETMIIVHN